MSKMTLVAILFCSSFVASVGCSRDKGKVSHVPHFGNLYHQTVCTVYGDNSILKEPSPIEATATREGVYDAEYNRGAIQTIGNNTFIPLNVDVPENWLLNNYYGGLTLDVLRAFEVWNPELEIVSFSLETQRHNGNGQFHVLGIFIHHKKR